MDIDWLSSKSYLFANPRTPNDQKKLMDQLQWSSHLDLIWLSSSGSTAHSGEIKLVALSKKGFLESAQAVNKHLKVRERDVWLNFLPLYHVGGLSIHARGFLGKNKVFEFSQDKWDADVCFQKLKEFNVSLTSLVPTQLFDLVERGWTAPAALRAVLVGGGKLKEELYKRARQLGWPVLTTYGMTEASSQVATASLESLKNDRFPDLTILSHVDIKIDNGEIFVKSPALLKHSVILKEGEQVWTSYGDNDWYPTGDLGEFCDGYLKIFGRQGDIEKVNGELVNLNRLNEILSETLTEQRFSQQGCFLFVPDLRSGKKVELVLETETFSKRFEIAQALNERLLPYERPRNFYFVKSLPKSTLGKVLFTKLKEKIGY